MTSSTRDRRMPEVWASASRWLRALRDGLTRILSYGGFEVVAAVPDAGQLLRAVAEHQPDLAVIDVRMPPSHTDEGIRAALAIRRQHPDVALLVLSQYAGSPHVSCTFCG